MGPGGGGWEQWLAALARSSGWDGLPPQVQAPAREKIVSSQVGELCTCTSGSHRHLCAQPWALPALLCPSRKSTNDACLQRTGVSEAPTLGRSEGRGDSHSGRRSHNTGRVTPPCVLPPSKMDKPLIKPTVSKAISCAL